VDSEKWIQQVQLLITTETERGCLQVANHSPTVAERKRRVRCQRSILAGSSYHLVVEAVNKLESVRDTSRHAEIRIGKRDKRRSAPRTRFV